MLALALDMEGVGTLALARYGRCWDVSSGSKIWKVLGC